MIIKARVLPILLLAMLFALPVHLGSLKYVPIYLALTIRANKKLPPHGAYSDSREDKNSNIWIEFEKRPKQILASGGPGVVQQGPYVLTQKRALEPIVIRKNPEQFVDFGMRGRKTEAQARQENEGPNWIKNVVSAPIFLERKPEISISDLRAAKRIAGYIELKEGLAVTNEHHIEVRRSDEGVSREMGRVDLAKGYYSIDVDEATGVISARLVDKAGSVLGEGSFRISQPSSTERLIYGPRLEIAPSPNWPIRVSSFYAPPSPPSGKRLAKDEAVIRTTAIAGELDLAMDHRDETKLENVVRGSSTVVRAKALGHRITNKIMVSGSQAFEVTTFPDAMIEALKSIVEDSGAPRTELEDTTIVWGRVELDGKPISGASVISETDSEAKPIYFNEFMIPDPRLSATSANGLYAFINIQQGFNAILATRGEAYFGHQNVVVEPGTVAIGDIQSSIRTEMIKVRAFDAFSGAPLHLMASMQSLSQPIELEEGSAVVSMAQVSRLSMIYTEVDPQYISANYFYNDQDPYIHLPVLSKDWIMNLKALAKINEEPNVATVVGFFGQENFEAYLAGENKDSFSRVIYFDASGKITAKGTAGGGFVMFNVSARTQEVVVIGSESEKIYSRVVPTDADMTSVISFTTY